MGLKTVVKEVQKKNNYSKKYEKITIFVSD